MSSTISIPDNATLLDGDRLTIRPIVVASDGSESSEPALMLAMQMAERAGGTIHVVAVHQLMPVVVPEIAMLPASLEDEAGRRELLRQQVESQLRRITGQQQTAWTIIIRDGEPATELAQVANDLEARVLVMGVKHRHLTDRLFGRETALRLLRHCRVPLLIVPAGFAHLPQRALIALDFSAESIEAGRAALRLFETITDVTLVHVTPSSPQPHLPGTLREWFHEDPTKGFTWARSALQLPADVGVGTVKREGHPPQEIVSVARDRGVDLIVSASRGAGLLDRLLIGSIARGVVHRADCAVLVVRPQ